MAESVVSLRDGPARCSQVARSGLSYRTRKAAKDVAVVERMKELSAQYPRCGYRRIRIFLGHGGHRISLAACNGSGGPRACRCRAATEKAGGGRSTRTDLAPAPVAGAFFCWVIR